MKLKLLEIPEEGLEIEDRETVETDGAPAAATLKARVEKAGRDVFLKGTVSASLSLVCSRCLGEFQSDADIPLDLAFCPEDEEQEEGHELTRGELDTGFYRDDVIDLGEIVKEQVLLNIPMKPLCREECKGICPRCGTNLNAGECGCDVGGVDPRLQGLRKYFEKGKE